jgi:hypothetical protein
VINGAYETVGAAVVWLNVRRLLRDREVKGVSWWVQAFFASWGVWNLIYYPALGQWCSFTGGIVLTAGSMTWTILAVKYIWTTAEK